MSHCESIKHYWARQTDISKLYLFILVFVYRKQIPADQHFLINYIYIMPFRVLLQGSFPSRLLQQGSMDWVKNLTNKIKLLELPPFQNNQCKAGERHQQMYGMSSRLQYKFQILIFEVTEKEAEMFHALQEAQRYKYVDFGFCSCLFFYIFSTEKP